MPKMGEATCNNCGRTLCSLKMALKKGWGEADGHPGRENKTVEQVIGDSALVCCFWVRGSQR